MKVEKIYSLAVGSLVLVCANLVQAQELRFGQATVGGSGCPQATAVINLGPEGRGLQVSFEKFSAEVGKAVNKKMNRSTCNVAIPIQVSPGYKMSLPTIRLKGANELSTGVTSKVRVDFFFAGQSGPITTQKFSGPLTDSFSQVFSPETFAQVWSECGAAVNLRLNISLELKSNEGLNRGSAEVRELDRFEYQVKKCN